MNLRKRLEQLRRRAPALALLLVAAVLGDVFVSDRASTPGCWPLPNGHALHVPFLDSCASQDAGLLASAEEPMSARVRDLLRAVAGAALLLFVPLVLFLRTTTASAAPLLIFYSCLAAVVAGGLAGRSSLVASYAALVALCVAPAALFHLSFAFPKRRRLLIEVPQIAAVPYLPTAGLLVVGLVAIDSKPLLWAPLVSLIGALGASAWLILMLSCWFALRESHSRFERARARLVLYGSLLLPLVPTGLRAVFVPDSSEVLQTYLWSSAALMPLPIALAITRYNLFDIGTDMRFVLARGIHVALASSVLLAVLGISLGSFSLGPRHAAEIFFGAVAAACVLTALQPRVGTALESAFLPELERLRQRRLEFESGLEQCADAPEVAQHLLRCIGAALAPKAAGVFVQEASQMRALAQMGSGIDPGPALAEEMQRALGAQVIASLALLSEAELDALPELSTRDVELIVRLRSPRGEPGLLLLCSRSSRAPYRGFEMAFAESLASQAAAALANRELTQALLRRERAATTGRIAVGLAHDLGKELDWLLWLVGRLPERLDQPGLLARDVELVGQFTKDVVEGVRGFIRDALRESAAPSPLCPASDVIDMAVRRVARLHGGDRVALSVDPSLRRLRLHEDVQRAVLNLLDNALRASPLSELVRLHATRCEDRIEIRIEDRGDGIPEALLTAVLEPGFTTRAGEGGSGVGLAVASEIAASHGGSVRLAARPGGGTRAVISLPVAAGEA